MKHINRIRKRFEYGEIILYLYVYFSFFYVLFLLMLRIKKYATDLRTLNFITTFAQFMNCLTK